ncbi:MAG TPA: protein-L-isoaspartate O-methyltransferase [Rhodanobacteraceae bacterium]|nr:protein-L-isoaspartate O-methyltransferase [Rhodanobacteraceae bacterium]
MTLDTELARHNMVDKQVRGWDVLDPRVLDALGAVPREAFVPPAWRALAFADLAIPLGHGECMLKPVVEGRLLQALALTGHEAVLHIGTGSGFLAACLGQLAAQVTSVDFRADFSASAQQRLASCAADTVETVVGDAVREWQPTRQYDVLVASGAVAELPPRWRAWLKPGGRLFAFTGHSPSIQARLWQPQADGELAVRTLFETDLPYLHNASPAPTFAL